MKKYYLLLGIVNVFNVVATPVIVPNVNCTLLPDGGNQINWSGCDKHGQNFENVMFLAPILHDVNFQNSNLSNTEFVAADLTGADLAEANLTDTEFRNSIWTNGHMCDFDSIGQCNQLTINQTMASLTQSYTGFINHGYPQNAFEVQHYILLALNSLRAAQNEITFDFRDVQARFPNINIEDPITLENFTPNERVVVLRGAAGVAQACDAATFYDYVGDMSFRFQNPLTRGNIEFMFL